MRSYIFNFTYRSIQFIQGKGTTTPGVEGGYEDGFGGEGEGAGGAGDGDFAVFEGLAEDFEGGATEFGEFVEEEDSVVGEGDFARAGIGAAAEESGIGDGVVGSCLLYTSPSPRDRG